MWLKLHTAVQCPMKTECRRKGESTSIRSLSKSFRNNVLLEKDKRLALDNFNNNFAEAGI